MKATDIRTGEDYAWKKVGHDPVWCRVVGVKVILNVEEGEDSPKGSAIALADKTVLTVPNREIIDRWSDHLIKNDLRDEYLESARRERQKGRIDRGGRAARVEQWLRERGIPELPRPVPAHDSDDREEVAVSMADVGFNVYWAEDGIPWVLAASGTTPRVVVDGAPYVFTSHQLVWLLTTEPAGD